MEKTKQFKLVDSLNSNKQVKHIKACNWYIREFVKKHGLNKTLDRHWKREHTGIKVISVITKQEIWVKA
jgi:hypothetical protein